MARGEMLFLNAKDVHRALPMAMAIEAMATAFAALPSIDRLGVKVVTVLDGNPDRGLPAIHGLVVVLRVSDGAPGSCGCGRSPRAGSRARSRHCGRHGLLTLA